jgi:hypothetical protein
MIIRISVFLIFLLFSSVAVNAHIGSPDVIYDGNAGPYKMQVVIQPPDVVPGIAHILVYFQDHKSGRVIIQPVYYETGSEGAPQGDVATAVPGSPGTYQGELWLMGFGASGLKISVEGSKGFGSTVVPVPAMATATRQMEFGTGILLTILGLILFLSLIFIIGASIREATIFPGMQPDSKGKRQAVIVMTVTGLAVASGLFFAGRWWEAVEGNYKKNMYKPISLVSHMQKTSKGYQLKIDLKNEEWLSRKLSDIVPDHGKLMHAFIIKKNKNIFVHLHPLKDDSSSFHASLPDLPPGNYRIFADVVHMNGIGETLTDSIMIKEHTGISERTDPDDSWSNRLPSGSRQQLDSNLIMTSEIPENLKAASMVNMRFSVKSKDGKAVVLQPYLGMSAHAVIMKDDGSTFIHLHPMGTVSMTAQYALANRLDDNITLCGPLDDKTAAMYDTTGVVDKKRPSLMHQKMSSEVFGSEIGFPYVFPSPGKYRIWVQVKSADRIYTAVFETKVE